MSFCFVSIRRHNHFMTELLAMISAAVAASGHEVDFAFDEFPELPDSGVYVAIPHEFYGHADQGSLPTPDQCARTVALCTENPGTVWFERVCDLLPQFGAVIAINRSSTTELRRRGIQCEHFQLGYSPLWDHWQREERAARSIDVLYLGAQDSRRDPIIAGYGRHLWARNCQFLIPRLEARDAPRADYLTGAEKHQRLRDSRLLLNLHRAGSASLEWVRFLESACNGCVMLTEPCVDHEPLIPGEHFVTGTADSLPLLANRLLDDPDRLRRVQLQAYDYVHDQLPMGPSVERLATLSEDLLRRAALPAPPETGAAAVDPPAPRPEPSAARATPDSEPVLGAAVRALGLETRELHRQIAEMAHRVATGGPPEVEIHVCTPAYDSAVPKVTVIVTVHDYEREVVEALASVAASQQSEAFDVLILDDASTDGSVQAVTSFLEAHPWLPARLLCQPVNRGLGHSRNALVERARGEYVFVLDADNGVYPSALGRLADALDADTEASFAYPMIAMLRDGDPFSLISALPWDPAHLREGNYIDAMALLRRRHILELGGYTIDPRLTGWEDFHLWCKCAEAGRYGILVAQVLAWYRRREHSMISEAEVSFVRAWSLMRARFPELLRPRGAEIAGLRV
jgi:CTP:molybdopterin cytidylyltransferase MocA